ncbi:hypothetical protein [Micromonospora sp. NPDC050200]|uniref:hypothetical protein n=1 Tax=Micromonospora sp. NPDC050200 TaxID=3155664 RepID=UPI003411483D
MADIADPRIVPVVEVAQCCLGGARVGDGPVTSKRDFEVGCGRWPEHVDEVRQPPGDRGDRRAVFGGLT